MIYTGFYTARCCVCSFNIFSASHLPKIPSISSLFIQFICLMCLSLGFSSSAAGNYNQGALYFAQGDYLTALGIWAPLAKQGNPAAQYSIGLLYDQGKGVEKDSKRALKYFQSAVEQNLPVAQYYLGMKYYAGLGVKKDAVKARQLLEKAAQSDYLQAQFQLANLYDKGYDRGYNKGKDALQDSKLATHWFTRAAENGYGPAQHSLATRFLTGRGTTLDLQQGIFWLKKAAEQRDSDAMRDLGFMYFEGMGVRKNFQQAHDLLLSPAEEGSGLALFLLGEIYAVGGDGIKKNLPQAKKWFQLSQKAGYQDAQKRLQQLSGHAKPSNSPQKKQKKQQKLIPKSADTRLTHDALRFKQLDDNYYLLQILTATHYRSISKLTDQYIDEVTYFLKIKKNKDELFILTYGYYQSYDEAKKAITLLPKIFQLKSKPWIRQVKHLKPSVL